MKVLICNPDENEARKMEALVKAFCKKTYMNLEPIVFHSPVDVAACSIRFDIAIIEVGMEDINGITLGKILTKSIPYIKLIYTSSQAKSLDDSFDVQAVRYYKRPYTEARFFSGLREAIRRVDNETICFDFKDDGAKVRVCKDEIIYIEIENRKTRVVTRTNTYFSNHSMTFWKEHLHSVKFLIPHNSFLVNIDYILKYKRNQFIVMTNGDTISIARGKGPDFNVKYTAYKEFMR